MRLVESADGTVRVVELDPTKKYVVILDPAYLYGGPPTFVNGEIVMYGREGRMTFVENPETIADVKAEPA